MSIIINNEKFYTPRGFFSESENISEPDTDNEKFYTPHGSFSESENISEHDTDPNLPEVEENKLVITNLDYSGGGRYVVETSNKDQYAFYIKKNGVYLDCSSKKVWVKHTTGALIRPIHAIAKIVTTPLKMVADIYKVCTKKISIKEFGKRSFEHLTDFIRIPFYSTLILITNILACTLSPILCVFSKKAATSLCMKAREIAGNLELTMYRVDSIFDDKLKREFVFFLYACFTPLVDLEGKSYAEAQSALKKFAESNIEFRRETKPLLQRPICDIITCSSTPAAGVYISPFLA